MYQGYTAEVLNRLEDRSHRNTSNGEISFYDPE